MHLSHSLSTPSAGDQAYTGQISVSTVEAGHEPKTNRIAADDKDDGYVARHRFCCACRYDISSRCNDVNATVNQLHRQCGQLIVLAVGPTELDCRVATFNVAYAEQTLAERRYHRLRLIRRSAAQK